MMLETDTGGVKTFLSHRRASASLESFVEDEKSRAGANRFGPKDRFRRPSEVAAEQSTALATSQPLPAATPGTVKV